MDFTLKKYRLLLETFQKKGYSFLTYEEYIERKTSSLPEKFVILRHDVDLHAERSLEMAKIEAELNVCATYYFRVIKQSNQPEIIRQIVQMNHEIGYHYEDLCLCKGNMDLAKNHFQKWLSYFRTFYPVKTICMHGSPTSLYDPKHLWKDQYHYSSMGIIGEPYFDTDFSDLFYITDTGRCWNGRLFSKRDRIPTMENEWIQRGWNYHSTNQIIADLYKEKFPFRLMMTTHPQRWTDNLLFWSAEYLLQTIKNFIKKNLNLVKKNI